VRFAGKGKGKSGVYRVITFFSGMDIPVFLLNIFAKNEKTDLTEKERHVLKKTLADVVTVTDLRGRPDEKEETNRRRTNDPKRQTSARLRSRRSEPRL